MTQFLQCLWHYGDFPKDTIQVAFELSDPSQPESPLRRLMTDGAWWSFGNGATRYGDITDLDAVRCFRAAVNAAVRREDSRWWKNLQRWSKSYMICGFESWF
jgi:hypothetical protein